MRALRAARISVTGDIAASVARGTIADVCVRGENLEFAAAKERVVLALGASTARRWAQAIVEPLPTLARKLGIASQTRLHVRGRIDDETLREALGEGARKIADLAEADLAIVRTDDAGELDAFVSAMPRETPPAWIVYVKGPKAPLGETAVRETMRRCGFIDVKVASVSQRLTALRFVRKA